jgi:hypothetical protein
VRRRVRGLRALRRQGVRPVGARAGRGNMGMAQFDQRKARSGRGAAAPRPARSPAAGLRRRGGRAQRCPNARKPLAHPSRGQLRGQQGAQPGQAAVSQQGLSHAQLGVGQQHPPTPGSGLGRRAQARPRPVERLLETAEGGLQIEAAQVGLPAAGQVSRSQPARPQPEEPQRLGRLGSRRCPGRHVTSTRSTTPRTMGTWPRWSGPPRTRRSRPAWSRGMPCSPAHARTPTAPSRGSCVVYSAVGAHQVRGSAQAKRVPCSRGRPGRPGGKGGGSA